MVMVWFIPIETHSGLMAITFICPEVAAMLNDRPELARSNCGCEQSGEGLSHPLQLAPCRQAGRLPGQVPRVINLEHGIKAGSDCEAQNFSRDEKPFNSRNTCLTVAQMPGSNPRGLWGPSETDIR